MPLFGKKTTDKSKAKEEKKEEKSREEGKKTPSVEDKYDLKDILGT